MARSQNWLKYALYKNGHPVGFERIKPGTPPIVEHAPMGGTWIKKRIRHDRSDKALGTIQET